ncbi:P-loop NTPase family protein [Mesohalobacter halotolerans]|uniref:Magnesium chelatase n=1 Tax=Mesohalobacter halotolerans TaxID=1883405 RepID=A0A4U5TP94_9FLAO|nr:magnesium chelatase [Mesohalobacter halotolerans]TKS55910.1 magnesium chelatase [Mesohalobacter halotolerans]
MNIEKIKTLGELKSHGYTSKSVKDELRDNLIDNIKNNVNSFEGIVGYENTVIPQVERAILSKHNINLLGLRGQAKTMIARKLIGLLDEYIPVVKGSEINDDPFHAISRHAQECIEELKDDTPIEWLHRNDRFSEKLATPDVSVADLIGDIDPIKAANMKLSYADDRVIHFGMIPRANRCIFVINELPDLQARIQVALFNILQEGDLQIRGFKFRFPMEIQFVFTANPEDYTNRGSIVTPLKDRIGSQILTHYPKNIEIAKDITQQEVNITEDQSHIKVSEIAQLLLEQISFEARKSEYIDVKSGISARLSISAYENLVSTAERRAMINDEANTVIRLADFNGILPAITGKVELLYEGEQEGVEYVAQGLIENAILSLYNVYFPEIKKLEKKDEKKPYDDIIKWFSGNEGLEILDDSPDSLYKEELSKITPLKKFVHEYLKEPPEDSLYFYMELVLWSLTIHKKLSKRRFDQGSQFEDLFGDFIKGI